jgi:hypothetical protein
VTPAVILNLLLSVVQVEHVRAGGPAGGHLQDAQLHEERHHQPGELSQQLRHRQPIPEQGFCLLYVENAEEGHGSHTL